MQKNRTTKSGSASSGLVCKPAPQTEEDRAAIQEFQARRKGKARLPKVHVEAKGNVNKVGWTHPDPTIADIRVANLLQSDDFAFSRGYTLQLARSFSTADGLKPEDLDYSMAVVRAIDPRDPTEALLAAQMSAVHSATMYAAQFFRSAQTVPQQECASTMLNKLARTFATQLESLKKYRSTGEQSIRVQHVTVRGGGQAIVGDVSTGGGAPIKTGGQPHEPRSREAHECSPALLSHIETHALPLQSPGHEGLERVPLSRGQRRSAKRRA